MKNPSIKIQKKLYSNVYFCREAMLVHISGGKNELVWKKTGKEGDELYCNQKKIVKVFTEGIGIWSDSIQTGCGDRIL